MCNFIFIVMIKGISKTENLWPAHRDGQRLPPSASRPVCAWKGGHEQRNHLISYVKLRLKGKRQVRNSCFMRGWYIRLPLPNWHICTMLPWTEVLTQTTTRRPSDGSPSEINCLRLGPAPMILAQGAEDYSGYNSGTNKSRWRCRARV
jgi:hypothetical protein